MSKNGFNNWTNETQMATKKPVAYRYYCRTFSKLHYTTHYPDEALLCFVPRVLFATDQGPGPVKAHRAMAKWKWSQLNRSVRNLLLLLRLVFIDILNFWVLFLFSRQASAATFGVTL